jgi:hypothetical protein
VRPQYSPGRGAVCIRPDPPLPFTNRCSLPSPQPRSSDP